MSRSEHPFDDITIEHLRQVGSSKWARFPDAIGAYIAEMDFGIAPPITQALHEAVRVGNFGYHSPGPIAAMGSAFAQFALDRYGWQVDPEDVRPVPDVLTALGAAIRFCSRPGSPIIIPTPAYMPFLQLPTTQQREIIQVPMAHDGQRYHYDLQALDDAFSAGGHLLVLCNPHNPIGRVLGTGELRQVAQLVQRHGGRVFADEIHAPLVYEPNRHVPYASVSDAAAEHAITAVSASKAWNLPGLKAAQVVLSNDEDRKVWRTAGPIAGDGTAALGMVAATAAYREGTGWLNDVVDYLDGSRQQLADLLDEHLPGARYRPPEGTYLAWIDVSGAQVPGRAGTFFRRDAGVILTDGSLCGDAGAGFIRYNFATPRPIMAETISRLGAAVTAARGTHAGTDAGG